MADLIRVGNSLVPTKHTPSQTRIFSLFSVSTFDLDEFCELYLPMYGLLTFEHELLIDIVLTYYIFNCGRFKEDGFSFVVVS